MPRVAKLILRSQYRIREHDLSIDATTHWKGKKSAVTTRGSRGHDWFHESGKWMAERQRGQRENIGKSQVTHVLSRKVERAARRRGEAYVRKAFARSAPFDKPKRGFSCGEPPSLSLPPMSPLDPEIRGCRTALEKAHQWRNRATPRAVPFLYLFCRVLRATATKGIVACSQIFNMEKRTEKWKTDGWGEGMKRGTKKRTEVARESRWWRVQWWGQVCKCDQRQQQSCINDRVPCDCTRKYYKMYVEVIDSLWMYIYQVLLIKVFLIKQMQYIIYIFDSFLICNM